MGATGLCLGGGVAANSRLRERLLDACVEDGLRGFLPSWAMCTDNAAMVASAAWYRWRATGPRRSTPAPTRTSAPLQASLALDGCEC